MSIFYFMQTIKKKSTKASTPGNDDYEWYTIENIRTTTTIEFYNVLPNISPSEK